MHRCLQWLVWQLESFVKFAILAFISHAVIVDKPKIGCGTDNRRCGAHLPCNIVALEELWGKAIDFPSVERKLRAGLSLLVLSLSCSMSNWLPDAQDLQLTPTRASFSIQQASHPRRRKIGWP